MRRALLCAVFGLFATACGFEGTVQDLDSDPCAQGACEGAVTALDALGAEAEAATTGELIVSIAMAEVGRGPTEVGLGLTAYPYDLGRYLYAGEAWCSEFVAWAYRVQGDQPFTGGTEGGWMLKNTTSIRSWFINRGRWIDRSNPNWSTFVPSPGDYVRYVWADGNSHSGIVRYADGTTLYTVEGNVSNTVRLMQRNDYKNYASIDGFGVLAATPDPGDTTPPSVPQGLTLTVQTTSRPGKKGGRTTTYVVSSWLASTDNSGSIAQYRVYRNGSLLGSTSQLSLRDGSTTTGQTYTYTVVAVDAAGNASAPSSPASVTR